MPAIISNRAMQQELEVHFRNRIDAAPFSAFPMIIAFERRKADVQVRTPARDQLEKIVYV